MPAQVVVVDQSDRDRTAGVVERHASSLSITYVRQEPLGLAVSQNLAVARATCSLVAVIDDDCVADSGWLATIERVFAEPGGVEGVTGRVLPQEAVGDRVHPVASRTSTARLDFSGKTLPWPVGGGNNFAVAREWFHRIGGCDERLGPGSPGEGGVDMDLIYRLLRAGARIRYEPDAVVYHERQTREGRALRRPMYGHGMAACCMLRLREGDFYALRMLVHWLLFRGRLLASGLRRRQWMTAREEWQMLGGSVRGLVYGIRVRGGPRRNGSDD